LSRRSTNPYQDIVYLAKDLGAQGIDLDYEEDWHADYYKYGTGPCESARVEVEHHH